MKSYSLLEWRYVIPLALISLLLGMLLRLAVNLLRPERWRSMERYGYYPGSMLACGKEVDPKRVVGALQVAETCLIRCTRWNAANLALVGHYVHVSVGGRDWSLRAKPAFVLLTDGTFASLAHELAHLCELVLDGQVNHAHVSWGEDGIQEAVQLYAEWVDRQGSIERILTRARPPGRLMNGKVLCRHRDSRMRSTT